MVADWGVCVLCGGVGRCWCEGGCVVVDWMQVGEVRSWAMMELRFLMHGICVRAPAVVVRGFGSVISWWGWDGGGLRGMGHRPRCEGGSFGEICSGGLGSWYKGGDSGGVTGVVVICSWGFFIEQVD